MNKEIYLYIRFYNLTTEFYHSHLKKIGLLKEDYNKENEIE